jgi:hypothetical protein
MVAEELAGNLALPALMVRRAAPTLVLGHLQEALHRLVLRVLEALAGVPTQPQHLLAVLAASPAVALAVAALPSREVRLLLVALVVMVS